MHLSPTDLHFATVPDHANALDCPACLHSIRYSDAEAYSLDEYGICDACHRTARAHEDAAIDAELRGTCVEQSDRWAVVMYRFAGRPVRCSLDMSRCKRGRAEACS